MELENITLKDIYDKIYHTESNLDYIYIYFRKYVDNSCVSKFDKTKFTESLSKLYDSLETLEITIDEIGNKL